MRNGIYRIHGDAKSITGEKVELDGEYDVFVRTHTNGLYADVNNRVIISVNKTYMHSKTICDALRTKYPLMIEAFEGDDCLLVNDLMQISLPDDFRTFADEANAPHANPKTLAFLINYCAESFQEWELESIYLMGSRASGIRSNGDPVSERSDHDFLVVIGDNATDDMQTGGQAWTRFYNAFNTARTQIGLGGVDLFVKKKSSFEEEKDTRGTVGFKAMNGIIVAQRAS